jgi:hypothetical protein
MTPGMKNGVALLVLACFSSICAFHCGQNELIDEEVDQFECLDESGLDLKIEIPPRNTTIRYSTILYLSSATP